ncbi:MAG: ECF-type sigma factor [Planctomycetota bacterium]|jgi:RNA polymerase sigma factor (sigma-70 family)
MSSGGSVTHWFDQVQRGDSLAAQALWERYFPELVRLARRKLHGTRRGAADEEDVALSVMDSVFDAAQKGRFPSLADRHDLWRLLIRVTANKVIDLKRRETRQRRGGGRVRGDSALGGADSDSGHEGLAQAIGNTPTPEFVAIMAEECRRLLERLNKPELHEVAQAKMEGYTNQQIADKLDCSERTVERYLERIRTKWRPELPR